MKKLFSVFLILVIVFYLDQCAYMINGAHQEILVETKPIGSKILLDGEYVGESPISVRLKRAKNHILSVEKDSLSKTINLKKQYNRDYLWYDLFWFCMGGIIFPPIDFITGAWYSFGDDLSNQITINLIGRQATDVTFENQPQTISYQDTISTVLHQYELLVVDIDGNPLDSVKIEYLLKDRESVIDSGSIITNPEGLFKININASSDPAYSFLNVYKSMFQYTVSKEGYYFKNGSISSTLGEESIKKEQITLIRPIDYFNKDFASSLSDIEIKNRILDFIDLIILQGLITESILETQSINLTSFKNNIYISFKFTNINVYNSLKLDKYDIGKRLFDEVIRRVLGPLNEFVAKPNLFYGYDLIVIGFTKSFADENAISYPVEYRFLIPSNTVTAYKNKDITGQQVLDSSVILMDDERIDLKLQ